MTHWYIEERICIRYENIKSVETIIEKIKKLLLSHQGIDTKEPTRVALDKLSSHSIEVSLSASTKCRQKDEAIIIKQEILLEISSIVAKEGADFAYPTSSTSVTINDPIVIKGFNG